MISLCPQVVKRLNISRSFQRPPEALFLQSPCFSCASGSYVRLGSLTCARYQICLWCTFLSPPLFLYGQCHDTLWGFGDALLKGPATSSSADSIRALAPPQAPSIHCAGHETPPPEAVGRAGLEFAGRG